jgi:cation:H+ antiporter
MLTLVLFAAGFVLLLKGADFLVDGASSLARRAGVSDLAIGLTVVAFGTSAPELFVNVISSATGRSSLAVGNIFGSNIANVLLILGVAALIRPLRVSAGTVWREIPFALLAALVCGAMANDQWLDGAAGSMLSRSDGIVLLAFFLIFLYYSATVARRPAEGGQESQWEAAAPGHERGVGIALAMSAGGLVGLVLGGHWIVEGAVFLAELAGLSERTIGLTVVAVGTSLPELATSAVAARKGNVDIAVGNVVGSNIFNIFLVLGTSATVAAVPVPTASNLDLGVVVATSILLFVTMFTGTRRRLDRWEGAVFLLLYLLYLLVTLLLTA